MIAERYLAEHLEGRSLGILPSRREFAGRDGGRDTNGMELLVRTLELPAELPAEPQVLAAANTNVGLMAGLMANIGERREVCISVLLPRRGHCGSYGARRGQQGAQGHDLDAEVHGRLTRLEPVDGGTGGGGLYWRA
ncbi:unnamed protein product [Prorocentrum cordatum]|uniref:Uncharacterized protein n=2 Tax=Prorocentrum cordatum TaxID=2364126 RepID=A0ABN9SFB3_9DINO|nr:unnamed protein product [Polarella glacialis]